MLPYAIRSSRRAFAACRQLLALFLIFLLGIILPGSPLLRNFYSGVVLADSTAQTLPFTQNWTNTGLITANDNWSGVPGIEGYLGQDVTTSTGTDPQTLLGTSGVAGDLTVLANQTATNITNGDVAEFHTTSQAGAPGTNPTIALQGSGTADAPYVLLYLNTTGQTNINVAYNLRDIDCTTDNAQMQVALQYRVGSSGNFTNIPTGYVSDATTGPSLCTAVTAVSAALPAAADNQSLVQVRIMSTNAVGNDEWVGVDDINITAGAGPVTPTLSINDVTQAETNSSTTTFIFTVSLTAPAPAGGVSFTINTADGTTNPANAGSDYVAITGGSGSIAENASSTTVSVTVNGDTTSEPNETFFVNLSGITGATAGDTQGLGTIQNDDIAVTAIHDIQGSGDTSPLNGQTVSTTGIVTLLKTGSNAGGAAASGFFMQDANADADTNTSEGIFVFTSSVPTVSVGDNVTVTGTVVEFTSSGSTFTITEISPVTSIVVNSTGNTLPTAVTLDSTILSPTAAPTQPQLEKYEGMRLTSASLKTVAPNDNFYDVYTVLSSVPRPLREPGIPASDPIPPDPTSGTVDCCIPIFDENPERIKLDTNARAGAPNTPYTSNVTLTNVTGPLDYAFNEYRLIPDAALTASANISAVPVPVPTASEFTVAGQNIENFANNATQRQKAALAIRTLMLLPDIIGMVEINNLTSLQALATQVNNDTLAATGTNPNYVAYLIPAPTGGTQHLGFLVKSSRVQVDSVTQERAGDTYIQPSTGTPDETHDRPPLVLRAHIDPTGVNLPVIVVVNHPRSFIDIELVAGAGLNVRAKRKAQGESLASLFQELQTNNPTTSVIGVGDYNAYEFNDGYTDPISVILGNPTPDDQIVVDASPDVVNPNFVNLINEVPASERYTYIFEGTPQAIDHVLVNTVALARRTRIAISHHDADFPEDPPSAFASNVSRPERNSDHDTPVAYFSTGAAPSAPNAPDLQATSDTGTFNDDNITTDNSPTFDITGLEPGATVELLRDGSSLTPAVTGVADSNGNVTLSDPGPLADGQYSYTVTQTTPGGTSDPSPALLVTIDTTAPTALITEAEGQGDPTPDSPINFAVTFSEDVTGFDSSDIQIGGTAGATTAVVTGSGANYSVAVSGMTSSGTVTITFLANAATNAVGMGNTAPSIFDNTVTFISSGSFSAFVVTKTADTGDGTCDADCSLREAITAANADEGAETITFAPGVTGAITLATELPAVTGPLTITGPGATLLTVQRDSGAATQFRVLTLTTSEAISISGLTISGGNVGAPGGGGIFNDGAQLQLTNVIVSGNTATTSSGMGGGILSAGGSLTLTSSTVTNNDSGCDGGGIDVFNGTLHIEDSTISNNDSSISGGGIFAFAATTTILNSTISGNTSVSDGGGIYNFGTLTITNSTISTNTASAPGNGGGIYNNAGALTVTSITLSGNTAGGGSGGGIYNNDGGGATTNLRNTIVANSNGGSGQDLFGTFRSLDFNLIENPAGATFIVIDPETGVTSPLTEPNNNITGVDPNLGPLANNGGPTQTHALLLGSPAIDAGISDSSRDQRGFDRPADNPFIPNVADGSDIGAVEMQNQPPVNSVPGAQATNEDTPLVFSLANGNQISISDPDAGVSHVQVTLTATNGTISLASTAGLNFSVGDGTNDVTMTFTGSVSDINTALNGLTFTPTPNYSGAASLQITTNDLGFTGGGGPQIDSDTINITVNAVNDPPVANNDAYSVNENGTLNVPAPGVLSNDTDVENSTLTAVLVSTTPNGTLVLNANGSFTYTPQAGFSGTDSFTYKANDGGTDGNTATVTITVNEGGTLAFDFATYNVNENGGSATITITRTGGSAGTATVLFSTSNGTASASDYTSVSTTVTFNDGEVSKTVNVPITDDTLNEANETINLTLSNAGGTGQLGSPSAATLTITDNDAQPALSINDVTVTEGNSGTVDATFTVTLSTASGQTVTVNYATADGTATIANSDYQVIPSTTLTFLPGETTKTVTVKVNGDLFFETDEDFFVNLSGQTNSTIADASGRGVITNDDASPTLSINDVTVTEGNAGTINATFTVTMASQIGQTVTVNYQTADGTATAPSDYQAIASTVLTFLPGETTKNITVQVNGDTANEANETFFVNLSGAVNATITDNQGLGTILNDDATSITLSAASYNITEDGLRATVVVNRQGDLSQASRVDYLTSDPSGLNNCDQVTGNASSRCDYATTAGTLRFAAGESSKVITIPIVNDVYLDGPEVFTLTLSNIVGSQFGAFSTATITITDNDTAPAPNPIGNDEFFIRQLYIDILGREPEPARLAEWLAILNHCAVPTDCDRIAVARGFVRSPEFQDRGYFVYRAFRASLGRFATYEEFIPDMAKVSGFLSAQDLEANKVAYIEEFMNRQEFKNIYDPTIGNPTAYVDTLLQRADLPNHPRRAAWIAGLTNNTLTRAQVLRELMESNELYFKYVNEAFIVMNYFGFLRRNPDAAYLAWLNLFNQTMDDRVIINGFINSIEYRVRFGPNQP